MSKRVTNLSRLSSSFVFTLPPEAARAVMHTKADHFRYLLGVYTKLVLIGVAIEGIEFAIEAVAWMARKWKTRKESTDLAGVNEVFPALASSVKTHSEFVLPAWVKFIAFAGLVLVVVGVRGELIFEDKLEAVNNDIQNSEEAQLTQEEVEIGTANARAVTNERESARLSKDAAGLREKAEAEHLARVKIEAAVAWRSLDELQKREIGIDLARFRSKAGVSIWFNSSSTEAELFAQDIAEALRSGHIDTTAPGGVMELGEGGGKWNAPIREARTGVILQSTRVSPAPEFADALIKELTSRGFDAKRQTDPPFDETVKAPVIWINVEPRPKGPQGEYKLQAEREANATNRTKSKP